MNRLAAAAAVLIFSAGGFAASISFNTATKYQTIHGWEATVESGHDEVASFPNYADALFTRAINDLGLTRLRLEIRSGAENNVDNWTLRRNGTIDDATWRDRRYRPVNDNADAAVGAAGGFQFSELDYAINTVANPLRAKAAAAGQSLYINLNLVDFRIPAGGAARTYEQRTSAAEYAEFMSETFKHMQSTFGWTPNAIELVLEPDNTDWTATQMANALVAAGDRLKAEGFTPDFIAPSSSRTAGTRGAVTLYDNMLANSPVDAQGKKRVLEYLDEFAYHRYETDSTVSGNLPNIASRAAAAGLRTSMLEHINADYLELHEDLKVANVSAWQQYALAYNEADDGSKYYVVNDADPNNPTLTLSKTATALRQYFKYIRPGAVRVATSSDSATYDPLAFINPDGKMVLVIKQTAAGLIELNGLPAGEYGITWASDTGASGALANQMITAGQTLSYTTTFTRGVSTVFAVPEPAAMSCVLITAPLALRRRRR